MPRAPETCRFVTQMRRNIVSVSNCLSETVTVHETSRYSNGCTHCHRNLPCPSRRRRRTRFCTPRARPRHPDLTTAARESCAFRGRKDVSPVHSADCRRVAGARLIRQRARATQGRVSPVPVPRAHADASRSGTSPETNSANYPPRDTRSMCERGCVPRKNGRTAETIGRR